MAAVARKGILHFDTNERRLSIIIHSLFSSWMLAFIFEGQILYSLMYTFDFAATNIAFGGMAAVFIGLLLCGLVIKTKKAAKRLFQYSYPFLFAVSLIFFFPPSALWTIGIVTGSFLAGCCVAAWGFYLKCATPTNERIKTIADMLILSNVLMILLNMAAIHISPRVGLALSMLMLVGAFLLTLKLPVIEVSATVSATSTVKENPVRIAGILIFLCIFITIITINSGLMYQVINPSFAHLEWLTSWYWAIPYVAALFIMRNLPKRISRTYMLYVAIAMIGLSFIGFMSFNRSVASYLVVNTLMLGACGVYDLFWWSILGGLLELYNNPAKILGIGLSANVLGVLLGGLVGNALKAVDIYSPYPTLLALTVVCVVLALLPPLHRHLSFLLKNHVYLTAFSEMPAQGQTSQANCAVKFENLSERESQVASLLLQGKTYRKIASELYISENTVKYYVKNIYSKLSIKNRGELIDIMFKK